MKVTVEKVDDINFIISGTVDNSVIEEKVAKLKEQAAKEPKDDESTDENIEQVKLYITAAGYYRASINGKRVGKNVLDPAWTDFSKRIYYSEYNVSSLLKNGRNKKYKDHNFVSLVHISRLFLHLVNLLILVSSLSS